MNNNEIARSMNFCFRRHCFMFVWPYQTLLCYDAKHCLREIGREIMRERESEEGVHGGGGGRGEGRIELVIIHHKAFSNSL